MRTVQTLEKGPIWNRLLFFCIKLPNNLFSHHPLIFYFEIFQRLCHSNSLYHWCDFQFGIYFCFAQLWNVTFEKISSISVLLSQLVWQVNRIFYGNCMKNRSRGGFCISKYCEKRKISFFIDSGFSSIKTKNKFPNTKKIGQGISKDYIIQRLWKIFEICFPITMSEN